MICFDTRLCWPVCCRYEQLRQRTISRVGWVPAYHSDPLLVIIRHNPSQNTPSCFLILKLQLKPVTTVHCQIHIPARDSLGVYLYQCVRVLAVATRGTNRLPEITPRKNKKWRGEIPGNIILYPEESNNPPFKMLLLSNIYLHMNLINKCLKIFN